MKNVFTGNNEETDDIKYTRMCCGAHVTVGTQIICFLNILFVGFAAVYYLAQISSTPFSIAFIATVCILTYIIYGLGFYGVQKIKPNLLIPLVIVMGLHIILSVADNGYAVYTFVTTGTLKVITFQYFTRNWPYYGYGNEGFKTILFTLITRAMIHFVFNFWLFMVVFRCYQYLIKKVKADSLPIHLPSETYQP